MRSKDINRRELLKGATAICAASALGLLPFAGCKSSKKVQTEEAKKSAACQSQVVHACPSSNSCQVGSDFTIVLHGLFFIELWRPTDTQYPADKKVRIVAPDCSNLKHIKHAYKAGSWGKTFVSIRQDYYHADWNPNNPMTSDKNLPEILQAGNSNDGYTYFSLSLPYPKSIRGLRVIRQTGRPPGDFPLVTALTYGADRPPYPLMVPASSWDQNANFHIFAEPDCIMNCDQMVTHSIETQKAAKDCLADYPVEPTPVDCQHPPDPIGFDSCPPCLGAPGVHCEEEISLWEMKEAKHCPNFDKLKPFAVHMPTCASLLLTPP